MSSFSQRQKLKRDAVLAEQEEKRRETAAVVQVIQSLRLKDQWTEKIADATIRAKYHAEALSQGVHVTAVDKALSILDTLAQCHRTSFVTEYSASGDATDHVDVKICIGEEIFDTNTAVLTSDKDSMLTRMFSSPWFTSPDDPSQPIAIHTASESPMIFAHILAYLQAMRDGSADLCPTLSMEVLCSDDFGLLQQDCDYLGIQTLPIAAQIRSFVHDIRSMEQQKKTSVELQTAEKTLDSLKNEKLRLEKRLAELPGHIAAAEKDLDTCLEARKLAVCPRHAKLGDEIKVYYSNRRDQRWPWARATVAAAKDQLDDQKKSDADEAAGDGNNDDELVAFMDSRWSSPIVKPLPPPTDYFHVDSELKVVCGGVTTAHDFLPPMLADSLEKNLDTLLTAMPIDVHPGSNCQVVDLIHPSMYPFIDGISPISDSSAFEKCETVKDTYAWLPAEFVVDAQRNVSISSYINNLDRAKWPELYQDIGFAFTSMLPMFEKTLKMDLASRQLQVIVKAAYYLIPPGESYEGSWHIEGMPHENITASGIYYISVSDNIENNHLSFRSQLDEEDYYEENGRAGDEITLINEHGHVATPARQGLVWSNDMQHRVGKLHVESAAQVAARWERKRRYSSVKQKEKLDKEEAQDSTRVYKTGIRKILCFFLVDPTKRVVSSEIVPPQQGGDIITLEQAVQHRQKLMNARKYYANEVTAEWEERTYTFCEH